MLPKAYALASVGLISQMVIAYVCLTAAEDVRADPSCTEKDQPVVFLRVDKGVGAATFCSVVTVKNRLVTMGHSNKVSLKHYR